MKKILAILCAVLMLASLAAAASAEGLGLGVDKEFIRKPGV